MFRVEVNATTGEVTEIKLTLQEIADRQAMIAAKEAQKTAKAKAEAIQALAKAAAQAKLAALGLTTDDLAALGL